MLHLLLALTLEAPNRCSDPFFQNSWDLLATARYGLSPYEQAAWVIAQDDRVTFVRWRFHHAAREASFRGVIPRNAIAIVHTHPNGHESPSEDDRVTAARLGIPVYVVTRMALSRTDGRRTQFIVMGDWNPDLCGRR